MLRDPKQFLLLHVEKVVLVVMVILLVLVVYAYHPWSVEVKEKASIDDNFRKGERLMDGKKGGELPEVPDYVQRVNGIIEVPWPEGEGPRLLPQNEVIFFNLKKGVWVARAPDPPPVVPAKAVYAKADRGQAVVVFQLDDQGQRRALEGTAIQEYQQGLEFLRIEIYRVDKTAGGKPPVKITPADWLPEGLPKRYGAPAGWIDESGGPVGRVTFDEPVYVFAQPRDPEGRAREEQEWRRRMEMEMRQRMEEEMRREQDLRKRLEEERERRRREPDVTPRTPRRVRTPRVRTTPRTTDITTPGGWYYFIDRKVDPDARYEYRVIIYCKNPLYGSEQYRGERIPQVVQSNPVGTLAGTEVRIASFKKWYFQGGTASAELGTFKVRCFVGGRREVTMTEISDIVRELTGAEDTKKQKKPTGEPEAEGVWVEHNFTVRPGEEIGGKGTVTIDGDRREIDFGTGCCLVSIWNDVQVLESKRAVIVPGPDGQMKSTEVLRRDVFPQKLRIAYVDRKGNLQTRWQEVAPPLASTAMPD